jgi:hypothetical protein
MNHRSKKKSVSSSSGLHQMSVCSSIGTSRGGLFLWGLMCAAWLLRLVFLGNAELWQDELVVIDVTRTQDYTPWSIFIHGWGYVLSIGQMPLSFMFFNMFYHVFGWFGLHVDPTTPFLARLPATLWVVPAMSGIFYLAQRLISRQAGFVAAGMMGFFFFPVYYMREVYCYAQLLGLAPWAMYGVVRMAVDQCRSRKLQIGLFFALLGLLYAHLGALMLVLAIGLTLAAGCLWAWTVQQDRQQATAYFLTGVIVALALLMASPFILRFLLFNEAHTSGAPYALWEIVNDGVSKVFLGERIWAAALAWLTLLLGSYYCVRPQADRAVRVLFLAQVWIGLLLLAYATQRSQYLSARYFSPVVPGLYVLFTAGLFQWGVLWSAVLRAPGVAVIVARGSFAAIVAVHLLIYLPAVLPIQAKSTPFSLIADWINENVPAGTPYVMESAYEIRWVGQAFPTPLNQPVAPYVHMGGEGEVERLHEAQKDFITRFPEAPFIQSAHHNWDQPQGVWTWPHEFYQRHFRIDESAPVRRLIRLGIYPGLPYEVLGDVSYTADIYYNTAADLRAAALDRSPPLWFSYPGWVLDGMRLSPQQIYYFRLFRGSEAQMMVHHEGATPLAGELLISAMVPGASGPVVPIHISQGAQRIYSARQPVGQAVQLAVPVDTLAPGDTLFTLRAPAQQAVRIIEVQWR